MVELNLTPEQEASGAQGACLKVFGVGGAGTNAVNSMALSKEFPMVEFIVANTDAQSLSLSVVKNKIHMGSKITKGLGAGSNPDTGRRAAEEDLDTIIEHLTGTDILFLTGGFGGGTGSGGLPVIANAAKELGILTVSIVTKPFLFEGKRRQRYAQEAIENIKSKVDTLIVVPNQRLLEIADPKISMIDAFSMSNSILKNAVKGISDIITKSGHINVDFADVKAIMKDMGMALMGTGVASGEDRARHAALNAINSPLLENLSIRGAKGVLINITGNKDLGLQEINDAAMLVYDLVSEDANIILGSVVDEEIKSEIMVTVIATGFDEALQDAIAPLPARKATEVEAKKVEVAYKDGIKTPIDLQIKEFVVTAEKKEEVEEDTASELKELREVQVAQIKETVEAAEIIKEEKILVQEAQQKEQKKEVVTLEQEVKDVDRNDLDTPAFLRKQAQHQELSS